MTDSAVPTAELRADALVRRFGSRTVIRNVSLHISTGDALAVTGRNGSGKSTLMKMLANVTESTEGSVSWTVAGRKISEEQLPPHLGYAAPYLQLYDEFTAWEHLEMMARLRALPFDAERSLYLLEAFNLADRRNDLIKTFSSGMTQRMKLIIALVHRPLFLFLDEPRTNLDTAGIRTMEQLVLDERESRVTLVATNDPEDLKLCTHRVAVEAGDAQQ